MLMFVSCQHLSLVAVISGFDPLVDVCTYLAQAIGRYDCTHAIWKHMCLTLIPRQYVFIAKQRVQGKEQLH